MNTQLNRTIKSIVSHTQYFANNIQKELADTGLGKNLPIDLVLDMVNTIIKQEIGGISVTLNFSERGTFDGTTSTAGLCDTSPASNMEKQLTLQIKPLLSRDC